MSSVTIADTPSSRPIDKSTDDKPKRPVLDRVDLFEHSRQVWTCKAPPGATTEDLLYEEFWQRAARRLNRHDIVFVIADDESWEAELRVEKSGPLGVEVSVVKKMKRTSFTSNRTILGDGEYVTTYQDGAWCVLRTKDKHPIIQGHATESAAIGHWLREVPRRGA